MLFRAQGIGGINEMHAILTPSTKGLRDALKDILYSMPLMPASQNNLRKPNDAQLLNLSENSNSSCLDSNNDERRKSKENGQKISSSGSCTFSLSEVADDSLSNPCWSENKKKPPKLGKSKLNEPEDNCENANEFNPVGNSDHDEDGEEGEEEDTEEPDEWLEQVMAQLMQIL